MMNYAFQWKHFLVIGLLLLFQILMNANETEEPSGARESMLREIEEARKNAEFIIEVRIHEDGNKSTFRKFAGDVSSFWIWDGLEPFNFVTEDDFTNWAATKDLRMKDLYSEHSSFEMPDGVEGDLIRLYFERKPYHEFYLTQWGNGQLPVGAPSSYFTTLGKFSPPGKDQKTMVVNAAFDSRVLIIRSKKFGEGALDDCRLTVTPMKMNEDGLPSRKPGVKGYTREPTILTKEGKDGEGLVFQLPVTMEEGLVQMVLSRKLPQELGGGDDIIFVRLLNWHKDMKFQKSQDERAINNPLWPRELLIMDLIE